LIIWGTNIQNHHDSKSKDADDNESNTGVGHAFSKLAHSPDEAKRQENSCD